mmetsp:Transcript_20750/g.67206  ORF Transcript_20750/g.67206 Transcript_20750/m.67206 type:complete len:148 (+) Transcript_20750:63-506(+)
MWTEHVDPATERTFWHNAETGVSTWYNPFDTSTTTAYHTEVTQRAHVVNYDQQMSNRGAVASTIVVEESATPYKLAITLFIVAAVTIGIWLRIRWLRDNHPELLNPPKRTGKMRDRSLLRRREKGAKGPKGSKKMSQDGKGGRSANS